MCRYHYLDSFHHFPRFRHGWDASAAVLRLLPRAFTVSTIRTCNIRRTHEFTCAGGPRADRGFCTCHHLGRRRWRCVQAFAEPVRFFPNLPAVLQFSRHVRSLQDCYLRPLPLTTFVLLLPPDMPAHLHAAPPAWTCCGFYCWNSCCQTGWDTTHYCRCVVPADC